MLGSFPDENDGDGNTLSRFSKKVRNPFHMEILLSEACMVCYESDNVILTALIHVYLLRSMAESKYQKAELRQRP